MSATGATDGARGFETVAWFYLTLAGLAEIGWVAALKYSEGLTRPYIAVLTGGVMMISTGFLALSVKTLPLGTSYAVWTGFGTVGAAVLGIVLFGEPAGALRLGCMGLVLLGIVGLKASS